MVVTDDINSETIQKLTEAGVRLAITGTADNQGNYRRRAGGPPPHVSRFFYIWNFLEQVDLDSINNIIVTDTRDVIFQTNPSDWLDENFSVNFLLASSEGMRYKNEPWGRQNYDQTFGPFFYDKIKDEYIYNVGVIAGQPDFIKSLMLQIFQMSINRPIAVVDQAVYNFLLKHTFSFDVMTVHNIDAWAIQLGTTIEAVKAGAGDLGRMSVEQYAPLYEDNQPYMENGVVYSEQSGAANGDLKPFAVVHQWDRVPYLKDKIEELYGDKT